MCASFFRFDEYVGRVGDSFGRVGNSVVRVSGVGYGVFITIFIDSISDIFLSVVFVPKGVESKGSRLIEILCRPKS